MILIPLILSSMLDMSLPEFQPLEDPSGNYIVGYFDNDDETVIVEDVSKDDIVFKTEDNDDVVLEEAPLRSNYLPTTQEKLTISSNLVITNVGYWAETNYKYVTLEAGNYYSVSSDASVIYIGDNVTRNTQLSIFSDSIYYAESTKYILVLDEYYLNVEVTEAPTPPDPSGNEPNPEDPSTNDPSGNNPSIPSDLTPVTNLLNTVIGLQSVIAFILVFMAFVPFLTKCVDKIMFRKED